MPVDRLGLTDDELRALATVADWEEADLAQELHRRPWILHELLGDPAIVESVTSADSLAGPTSCPFLVFAVLTRLAADELLESTWVNEWVAPGKRLPVFDVEPLQEFVDAPARVVFVARLLTSFVGPTALPVPLESADPWELADWLDAVEPADRITLLRRLGDLALFAAGVHADAANTESIDERRADRVGRSIDMTGDEVLALLDQDSATPTLDALETLGARWYEEARRESIHVPPIVSDVASRIRPARRFLNHLSDRYLHPFEDRAFA